MKKEAGFTLIETIVAVAIIAVLSGVGVAGWQRWQAQQRLWQTALQVRHFLEQLRDDANWNNRAQHVYSAQEGGHWCLLNTPMQRCSLAGRFTLRPVWGEVTLTELTSPLGFYGLRNTAWPGHIIVRSRAGEWRIIVSAWGRIRMCQPQTGGAC